MTIAISVAIMRLLLYLYYNRIPYFCNCVNIMAIVLCWYYDNSVAVAIMIIVLRVDMTIVLCWYYDNSVAVAIMIILLYEIKRPVEGTNIYVYDGLSCDVFR
jgi:hypothetical protein